MRRGPAHSRWLVGMVTLALVVGCTGALERVLDRSMVEGSASDGRWPTPTFDLMGERPVTALDDPDVLLPSTELPPPTATPTPTAPPPEAGPARRLAFAWDSLFAGRVPPAQATFDAVVADHPERADAHLGAGLSRLLMGDDAGAREALQIAADLAPAVPEGPFYLGYLAYAAGDHPAAIELWMETARRLEGRPPAGLARDHAWLLARALLATGDRAGANRWMGRALKLSSGPADVVPQAPVLTPERQRDGSLPAPAFRVVRQLTSRDLGAGFLFVADGNLWRLQGIEPFRERVTTPPLGQRDDAFALGPGGLLAVVSRGREGLHLVVIEPDGARRTFDRIQVAPIPPTWHSEAEVLAVGLDEAGRERLLAFDLRQGEARAWPGIPLDLRLTDPVALPNGDLLAAVGRSGGFRLARITPGKPPKWLTDVPHDRDPWTVAGGDADATPVPEPPTDAPEATPMADTDPWGAPRPARAAPAPVSRPALRAPATPRPPFRVSWSPEDGGRFPPPTPVPGPPLPVVPTRKGVLSPVASDAQGDERHPALAADGRIAFSRQLAGQRRIWILDPVAGRQRPLTGPGQDCWLPAFEPGGLGLSCTCRRGDTTRIVRLDLATGEAVDVFADVSAVRQAVWVPEGWEVEVAPVSLPVAAPPAPTSAPTPTPARSGPPIFYPAPRGR